MSSTESIKENKSRFIKSTTFSALIHFLIFVGFAVIAKINLPSSEMNPQYFSVEFNKLVTQSKIETEIDEAENPEVDESVYPQTETNVVSISDVKSDTTNLDQTYTEKTLNVSIRYPKGWTFIDQNVKNKLDGVTFWSMESNFRPPPYIHLEVKEKYLFNASRFKFSLELEDCIAFYNDPEIMEEQVTQIIYLRTEDDQDFSLKLIIKGENNFKLFLPRFWGIIKSFDFGSSLF